MSRASGTERARRGAWDGQGVASAYRGQRVLEAGPGPAGAGQALAGVDPVGGDTE